MKKIIINTKSKPKRRSKKLPQTINITKLNNYSDLINRHISEKLIEESIKNKYEVKKINLINKVTPGSRKKLKQSKQKSIKTTKSVKTKYITHQIHINSPTDVFTIKNLKNNQNNQNIKYFKNLPKPEDVFVCSILSENLNIIKY